MLTRTTTTNLSSRAASIRRLRRRAASASGGRLYCSTNGCTSFLELDAATGIASCPICGYRRHLAH